MRTRVASVAAFLLFAACTDAQFFIPPLVLEHPLDNRIELSGGFCAEGADDVESFLKVMFIIDRSNSMNVTDPNARRSEAVGDVVTQFIENQSTLSIKEGVEFAIISFYGDVITHTRNELGLPGFSKDGPQIMASIVRLRETSSNTGYDKALATAFQVLDGDMARLADNARARSRYEIFFLSDGMPFPDNCVDEANSLPNAARGAARIKSLQALHRVSVTVHTGFASAPGMFDLYLDRPERCCLGVDRWPINLVSNCDSGAVTVGRVTRELLQTMADEGGGEFKQFENGDAINFLEFEFAEGRRLFALSNFVTTNTNARPDFDHIEADSDGDGLTDREEHDLGTSPYYPDSDGDGFSDGIEYRFRLSGFDPLDPTDAKCGELDRVDTDGDGLLDCEEIFVGTLRRSFDSDADGVPDMVEILARGDANSATPLQDHQADSDADGGSNADEMRWNTDPKADDVAERAEIAYDYFQEELPITSGLACYDFNVRNIQLASTLGTPANRQHTQLCMPGTPIDCNASTPCGPGQVCDYERVDAARFDAGTGACRPSTAAACGDLSDCVPGQLCMRGVGLCLPSSARECEREGDCGSAEVCDFVRVDADRAERAIGACRPASAATCADDSNCTAGQSCLRAKEQDGWNRIMLYFAQTPYDDPLSQPIYRLACVDGRYIEERDLKIPANGRYEIPARRPSDTYRAKPVLRPGQVACHVSNSADCGLETLWCRYDDDGSCAGCFLPPRLPTDSPDGTPHPVFGNRCPACADGIDNDGDGMTDFPFDPDCWGSIADNEASTAACSNGQGDDTDGADGGDDGRWDYPDDPGCTDYFDNDESDPATPPECFNGLDDDNSGATDYPRDPGCYAASDTTEQLSLSNPIPACNDLVDNDGDGLVDMADPGCSAAADIDEEGPAVCFFCEFFSEGRPNQCDIKAGYCRPRSGQLSSFGPGFGPNCQPPAGGGSAEADPSCRGAPCLGNTCTRCLDDGDCDTFAGGPGQGLCDNTQGRCLVASYTPVECTQDNDCCAAPPCPTGACDVELRYCAVDPYDACRNGRDCATGEVCSDSRGFCLGREFETRQCNNDVPCAIGACNDDIGWCLPNREEDQCRHDDECPLGDCLPEGNCEQQTFVFPKDFRPEVDCLRPD